MRTKPCEPLFRTPVDVPAPLRQLDIEDKNVFMGSCFAEHIGQQFCSAFLPTLVNPLGVIYNPESVALALTRTDAGPLVCHDGMWHSWLGDSTLSRLGADECRLATNHALSRLHTELAQADNLFLTLGTSHYYVYGKSKGIAANCHRLPSMEFEEYDLGVDEIVEALGTALMPLHETNPRMQVILTVSPYRYAKYGMHESQLAKARLLLASDRILTLHPDWMSYFPAYEIVMDELRDYRFYAEDMLHPSAQAVDYIWQRLQDEWMTDELRQYLVRWEPLGRALNHRPLHPESPEYETFQKRTQEQLQQLQHDYPMLSLRSEEVKKEI